MGVMTTKGYIPEIGESDQVWPAPMNSGLDAHFNDAYGWHMDKSKAAAYPDIYVHPNPDIGDDLLSGSRPDIPKRTLYAAVDAFAAAAAAVTSRGGTVQVLTDGPRKRIDGVPHIDLGSTPVVVNDAYFRLILPPVNFEGNGGTTGGGGLCWIRGAVPNGGLFQFSGGVTQFELYGGGLENTAVGGSGIEAYKSYSFHKIVGTQMINCPGSGIDISGSSGDGSLWERVVSTGCGWGWRIRSRDLPDLTTSQLPNNLLNIQGNVERSTKAGVSIEETKGLGGGRGLTFIGTKVQKSGYIDTSFAQRGGWYIAGPSAVLILNQYSEWIADDTHDTPFIVVRSSSDTTLPAGKVWVLGGEITNGGDISSVWSGANLARTYDVAGCIGFRADCHVRAGGIKDVSAAHPVVWWHAGAQSGYANLINTGSEKNRATDIPSLWKADAGVTSNWGEYWDGTRVRGLGTPPWS